MVKNHIKRIIAPKTWRVNRKTTAFITKPNPGAYSQALATSINTFLKEMAFITKTTKETKYLLTKQEIKVNGKRIRDDKYSVGFLDVIEIPSIKKSYRIVLDSTGKLKSEETKENKTLLKITGKTGIAKNKVQINTLSGTNLLANEKDAKNYKIGDSLVISLPDKKILAHIQNKIGADAYVFIGKHVSKKGKIESTQDKEVTIKTSKETFQTRKEYIITISKDYQI